MSDYKLIKTEQLQDTMIGWLFLVIANFKSENITLRLMLKKRGVSLKQLRRELSLMRETSAVKRRTRVESARFEKSLLSWLDNSAIEETLEQLPVKGKPH